MTSSTSLALWRLLSSIVFPRFVRPAVSSCLFNTNAVWSYEDGDNGGDIFYRSDQIVSPRDMSKSYRPSRSLIQALKIRDQLSQAGIVSSSGVRSVWDVKERENGLHLRNDMPGLSREDVKLGLEHNTLVIKGEGGGEDGRRFSSRIGVPEKVYNTDEIKVEMKNGVLKVVVPRLKWLRVTMFGSSKLISVCGRVFQYTSCCLSFFFMNFEICIQ